MWVQKRQKYKDSKWRFPDVIISFLFVWLFTKLESIFVKYSVEMKRIGINTKTNYWDAEYTNKHFYLKVLEYLCIMFLANIVFSTIYI